jgi:hypothetical protein
MRSTSEVRRYKRRTALVQALVVTAALAVLVLALAFPQA